MTNKRCEKYGHHYLSEIQDGIAILICDECGHKKTVNASDTKQMNYELRRLTIQPHQTQAWNETYGRNP